MAHHAESFRCDTCAWGRHCDDSNPAPFAKWVIRGVIESKTCLLPMITPQTKFLLRMHDHYRGRVLPYDGGMLDQPHYYAEMMEWISARDAEITAEEQARAQRQQRTAGLREMR